MGEEALGAGEQCPSVADDGARCQRLIHLDDPNEHDFTERPVPSQRIDGGRKWSEWIRMVHRVRGILLDKRDEETNVAYGDFDDPDTAEARKIAQIATVVGLTAIYDNDALVRITEPTKGVQ